MVILKGVRVKEDDYIDKYFCIPILVLFLVFAAIILIIQVTVTRSMTSRWNQWEEFSSCSVTCGPGVKVRRRICPGAVCWDTSVEVVRCVEAVCHSSHETRWMKRADDWNEWTDWSGCNATCEKPGVRWRNIICQESDETIESSSCEESRIEIEECFKECPIDKWAVSWLEWSNFAIDGKWGQWSNFTACTSPCGVGSRMRTRRCDDPTPLYNGSVCNGSDTDTKSCNVHDCYSWTSWAGSTPCSVSCGNGTMTRLRNCEPIVNTTLHFTGNCSGHSLETVPCFLKECIDVVDCSFENGGCSHSCLKNSSDSHCSCYPGYALDSDGKTCSDVDECIGANNCDGFCINASGTYFCLCYKPNHYWDRKIMKCIPNTKKNKTIVKIK